MATKQTPGSVSEDPVAHFVAVQLPIFNRLAPTSWFYMADANFHLRNITTSETKFWYVVSKLDADTLRKMSAFLAKPRGKDPYAEIRTVLCGTFEPNLEQKLDALLAVSELGDERPSEFALELRRLLADAGVEEILKRIFFKAMPKHLRDAISGSTDESFDGLVKTADKAWALHASATSAAVASTEQARAEEVPVTAVVARSAATRVRGGRQRGGRAPAVGRQESKTVVLCPFHIKWGDSARKCLPTCSRWDLAYRQQQQIQQVFHIEEVNPASEN